MLTLYAMHQFSLASIQVIVIVQWSHLRILNISGQLYRFQVHWNANYFHPDTSSTSNVSAHKITCDPETDRLVVLTILTLSLCHPQISFPSSGSRSLPESLWVPERGQGEAWEWRQHKGSPGEHGEDAQRLLWGWPTSLLWGTTTGGQRRSRRTQTYTFTTHIHRDTLACIER